MRVLVAAVAAAGALVVMGGCAPSDSATFDACQVNPTFQAEGGEWREADGELLDADPCDADDYDEHGKLKPGKVRKPTAKVPVKPQIKPQGPGQPAQPGRNNNTGTRS